MTDKLERIQAMIDAGDEQRARAAIQKVLKIQPSADAWVMAAKLTKTDEQAAQCLRRALKMDEWHKEANRMLYQIEGSQPTDAKRDMRGGWDRQAGEKSFTEIKRERKQDRYQKQANRQRSWQRFGCLMTMVLAFSCSAFSMRAIGLAGPVVAAFNSVTGGATPAAEFYGTPFAYYEQAALEMTPLVVNDSEVQEIEILDHGYMHEYKFNASAGDEAAIYIQFLSVNANRVSKNVILVDPAGESRMQFCDSGRILQDGDNNITLLCRLDKSGTWGVRVVGVNGESVGAYFVGVDFLN